MGLMLRTDHRIIVRKLPNRTGVLPTVHTTLTTFDPGSSEVSFSENTIRSESGPVRMILILSTETCCTRVEPLKDVQEKPDLHMEGDSGQLH